MTVVIQYASESSSPKISLSDSAKTHIMSYLKKNNDYKGIRISVKKTGCSGLAYVFDYVTNPLEGDLNIYLSEQHFIYIDQSSYPFLKNLHVDYVKQGLNYKFVFSNPNQTGQCGCGESFTVN